MAPNDLQAFTRCLVVAVGLGCLVVARSARTVRAADPQSAAVEAPADANSTAPAARPAAAGPRERGLAPPSLLPGSFPGVALPPFHDAGQAPGARDCGWPADAASRRHETVRADAP